MKKLITTTILFYACLLLVNAADITVTNNQDSGNGSFRNAVAQAGDGDNIIFNSDFIIFLETPIQLGDKTLSIDGFANGKKVILDGNYLDADNDIIDDDGLYTRIFTIIGTTGKEVNLSNLIIQNGSTYSKGVDPLAEISTRHSGGGMFIDLSEGGALTVSSCTIQNNILAWRIDGYHGGYQVTLQGAGVYSVYGGDFVDCSIKNNTLIAKNSYSCNLEGGGAFILEGGSFRNTLIAGNRILFEPVNNDNFFNGIGAGLSLRKSEVINCIIAGNDIQNVSDALEGSFSNAQAGGIYAIDGRVYNTTIVKNGIYNIPGLDDLDLVYAGGALLSYTDADDATSADYQNNILYGNYSSSGVKHDGESSSFHTKYTAISDAGDLVILDLDETSIWLEENPFIELPFEGKDGEWGTDDDFYGDLRLKEDAPLIDAGNPDDTQYEALALDFYGRGRINNNRIDIGALEFYMSDITYSLSGKVHAGSLGLNAGIVEVYDVNDISRPVLSVDVDSDGSFEFPSLVPGNYYFYAIPAGDTDFYSTWFGDETELKGAIFINVDDIIYDVDIHLISKTATKLGDVENVSLEIYPNPATEIVNINSSANIKEIVIYDSYRAQTKYFYGNNSRIMVSGLRPGVYVMSIVTEIKTVHKQLIIQ